MGTDLGDANSAEPCSVSIGIFAHNEEMLIGDVVKAFLTPTSDCIDVIEVIVVSSGSTDRTAARARAAATDQRVEVLEQAERRGKLHAVNEFLARARGRLLVVASGDTIPDPGLVDALCQPLVDDPLCGMTGCRIRQAPATSGWVGEMNQLLWELHHLAAMRSPKLGEVVAVRRSVVDQLPTVAYCDEVVMEALTTMAGYQLRYVHAVGATNIGVRRATELFRQRRRIHCQHLWARARLRYAPSTLQIHQLVGVVLRRALDAPRQLPWLVTLSGMEVAARGLATLDFHRGREYRTWPTSSPARPITSTDAAASVTRRQAGPT